MIHFVLGFFARSAKEPSTEQDQFCIYGAALSRPRSCTVLIDGEPQLACLTLAVACEGRHVETASGMADGPNLHPLQAAFMDHFAAQCGFCTPGMLITTMDLVTKYPLASDEEIREGLSGNLCRCTGYEHIVQAVRAILTRQS